MSDPAGQLMVAEHFASMVNETDEDMEHAEVCATERAVHQAMAEGVLKAWLETIDAPSSARRHSLALLRWQQR